MLDIALIRAQPDEVKQRLARLHDPDALARVDRILDLDVRRRLLLAEAEMLQMQRNRLNRALGKLRGNKQLGEAEKSIRMSMAAQLVDEGEFDKAYSPLLPEVEVELTDSDETDLVTAMQSLVETLRDMSEKYKHNRY